MKNPSFRIDFQPSFRETIISRGDDAWTNDLSIFFLLYTKLSFVHFWVSKKQVVLSLYHIGPYLETAL